MFFIIVVCFCKCQLIILFSINIKITERTVIPAIYQLEAKVVTRGVGRSAVAVSVYMCCSEITNEYDGVNHDYTKKEKNNAHLCPLFLTE